MRNKLRPQLIGESFSPWTKKVRWALEYCEIDYDYREYIPTLSEPGLRWRLRQWTGAVSVPVLFVGKEVHRGSWSIAHYADEVSDSRRLGPLREIAEWDRLSETALAEGRTRVVRCILQSNAALEESLPAFIPAPMRRPLRFVARDAVRRLDRKYAHLVQPDALRQALLRTRSALRQSRSDYLLGEFSYADITMAVVLEVIAPIARAHPPLGPATERCWHDSGLTQEFEDLVEWRRRLAKSATTSYSQLRQ